MGFRYKYELVGVAEFMSKETARLMGYNIKNCPDNHELVYSKTNELNNGLLFIKENDKYHFVHPQFIIKLMNKKEGKKEHPELFL